MKLDEPSKEAFKEFAKVVFYCCNFSKRKVYIEHLKLMMGYYFVNCQYEKNETYNLIRVVVENGDVKIEGFDDYLDLMIKMGYIDFEKNCYGTFINAKKKLELKSYDKYQLESLASIIDKSIEELEYSLEVNIQ